MSACSARRADRLLAAIDAAVGVSAIGGAAYAMGGAREWPKAWLAGSRFSSYRVPGLVLGFIHAPLDLAAAGLVARGDRRATAVAVAAGVFQVSWILIQVRIIGFRSFLQPLLGAIGAASLALSVRRATSTARTNGPR